MGTNEDFMNALDSDRSREIVQAIDEYKAEHGINTELSPEQIVDAARDPSNPLHQYFDWDDQSAAHKQRLNTARQLLSSVRYIVRQEGTLTYRAFTSVKESPADPRRYERISRVMDSESLQRARLKDFQRRLAGLLTEFADIPAPYLNNIRDLKDAVTSNLNQDQDAA